MLGVTISSCFASAIRSTIAMYLCVAAAIAGSYLVWKDLPTGDGASTTVIVHLRSRLGLSGGSNAVDALTMTFGPLAIFGYLFLIATNRIRPPKDDRTSALRVLTFVTALGLLAASAWAALPEAMPAAGAAGRRLSMGTAESFRGTVRLSVLLLFVAALVFSTEDARGLEKEPHPVRGLEGSRVSPADLRSGSLLGLRLHGRPRGRGVRRTLRVLGDGPGSGRGPEARLSH